MTPEQEIDLDAFKKFERHGWAPFSVPDGGAFLWIRHPNVDDTVPLAREAVARGMRLAPGAAFRPDHATSPWLRFAAAMGGSAALYELLADAPTLTGRPLRGARAAGSRRAA